MTKQASIMVKHSVAEKIRLISEKSGIPIARIIEELSKLADFIPQSSDSVSLVIMPKEQIRSVQFIVLPIYSGSFTESENMTEEQVSERIREDIKKTLSGR